MSAAKFKEVIENHPIFKTLEEEEDGQGENASWRANQLIHVQDGLLYLWNNEESCFYVSNLRMSLDSIEPSVQKLLCSPPPLFKVKSIIFNGSGTLVALIGSRGACVLTLPQKWRQAEEGQAIICKCAPVAERFFTTCILVQLTQAGWHPGSQNNCHLCLLLSDNTFRIYDVTSDHQTPAQVHKLGHTNVESSRFSLVSSAYSITSAIGETVVSFAFAPAVEVEEKRKKILQARRSEEPQTIMLYPIYLLQGDGDVLLLLTSVTDKRYRKGLMHGPLTMQPAAEDNYGVDACSILVLQSTPTVLAIATATGKIHHCVALSSTNYESDEDLTETQSTSSWPASVLSVHSRGLVNEFSPPMLFVYETVELEFEPQNNDDGDNDFTNHTITLHTVDRLEKDVRASMVSNSAVQAPLSTVEVFLNIASRYTLEDFLTELSKYGPIESIVRQSERSYRVVFRDLVGACNAVTGLKTNKDLYYPLLYCRYHCCTRLGIHAIVMPWVDKFVSFFEAEDEDKDHLNEVAQDQPCVVEHIVCTKPTPSSSACAVTGITFATNPLFGPSLLCLTADNHCTAVPLLTVYKPVPPPLLSAAEQTASSTLLEEESPSLAISAMDFEDHIRSILRRDSSQPILRYETSSRETLLDSEASRLISRVTQILRREYILKQKLAQDAISKRVQLLAEQKQQQLKDTQKLEKKKVDLTDQAGALAEKFEDCLDRQEILSDRVAEVLKRTASKVPVLSKAEIEMSKELKAMSEKMKHLKNRIEQVKTKHDYQNKQKFDDEEQTRGSRQAKQPTANPAQLQKFKGILLEEGQKIQELVKKLNNMKVMIDS